METLAALLKAQADSGIALTAASTAFGGSFRITYAELRDGWSSLVQQIGCLEVLGPRPASAPPPPAAMLATHSVETVIALTGLAAHGIPVAPINPAARAAELEFLLADVQAAMLLVPPAEQADSTQAAEAAAALGIPVCRIAPYQPGSGRIELLQEDALPERRASGLSRSLSCRASLASAPAVREAGPDDVAFLLHTSGTTSRPKLVPLTHGAVATNLAGLKQVYGLTSADTVAHLLPLFHVAGIVIGLLSTLATGGCVVLVPAFDSLSFVALLREHQVTWFTAVPTIFKGLLEHRASFSREGAAVISLRFIRSGAAATAAADKEALERLMGVPFIDSYGMTETSGGVFSTPLGKHAAPPGSVGLPITPTLQVQIVSNDGEKLPAGVVGEVCLRGPSVLKGYLNNPEANAEAFLPDGWFRTGDLGQLNKGGTQLAGVSRVLLCKYTASDDVLIATSYSIRPPGTENLIGYFLRLLLLRNRVLEGDTLGDLIKREMATLSSAMQHAVLPLQDIVQMCSLPRVPGANSTFQAAITYDEEDWIKPVLSTEEGAPKPSLQVAPVRLSDQTNPRSDIALAINAFSDHLEVHLAGDSTIFLPETVQRLSSSMEQLVHSVLDNPATLVEDSMVLSQRERQALSRFSCGPLRPERTEGPLFHEAFAQHAADSPNRRCLVFEGAEMTYGEVAAASDALAHALIAMGVADGTPVGVMLDRSFELHIAILGSMKAGGAYLPCDPGFPDDRLAIYLEDARAPVVLTEPAQYQRAEALAAHGCRVVNVAELIKGASGAGPVPVTRTPEDPVYVLFTSGSTGRPKGVVVPHRGLQDMLPWLVELHQLGPEDVVMFTITVNFDAHITQALPILTVGGTLVIAKPDGHMDAAYIADLIVKHQVTGMGAGVPSLAHEYTRMLEALAPVTCMRAWGLGGDAVPLETVAFMHEVYPNVRVINSYGPTEATVITVNHVFERGAKQVVIGKPDTNVHAYVVDAKLRPVPIGVPGELVLSGPRLATGYVGRPDLTAEKFVPNPCLNVVRESIPAKMLGYYRLAYRTGDLVRWRPDGQIEFLGRIDRQVKVNGVRIELGEVEAALASAPGVEQAQAAAVPDDRGNKRLVGYVVPATASPAEIIAHCRALLVPAMVPSVVVVLEAWPLLPNGKIDVKGLPVPDWGTAGAEEYVAPVDEAEAKVQRVWMEALGRAEDEQPLSVTADFYAAGGTSLQKMKLPSKLQEAFGVPVLMSDLVSLNTVREMAAFVEAQLASGTVHAVMTRETWTDNIRSASSGQQALYAACLADASGIVMNEPATYELEGRLSAKALQRAADLLLDRHELLRCAFTVIDGKVMLELQPEARVHITMINDGKPMPREEASALIAEEGRKPFDLGKAPLVAIAVARISPTYQILLITLHHAVVDGWSLGRILPDMLDLYYHASHKAPLALPPLSFQYADFAAWEQRLLQESSQSYMAMRDYWTAKLSSPPAMLQLPLDRPRPAFNLGTPAVQKGFALEPDVVRSLKELAKSLECSLYSLFVALFRIVLCKFSASDDVLISTTYANRPPGTENLIGYFLRLLLLRNRVLDGDSVVDLIKREMETLSGAMKNAVMPLQDVVKLCQLPRTPGANSAFQAMVTWDEEEWIVPAEPEGADEMELQPSRSMAIAEMDVLPSASIDITQLLSRGSIDLPAEVLKVIPMAHGEGPAKCDVTMGINVHGEHLVVVMIADGDVFAEPTVERIAAACHHLIHSVVRDPRVAVASADIMPPSQLKVLKDFSCGAVHPEYQDAPLFHEAFGELVRRQPSAPCLTFAGESRSYGEVGAAVDALADSLVGMGAGAGTPVGVMLDRSFELVIAILAIMKAGAAYVPCDPGYPDDRLAGYLEDSKAVVLLTEPQHLQRAEGLAMQGCRVVLAAELCQPSSRTKASRVNVSPEDPIYIIFTSGSTGRPKGVVVRHGGVRDYSCFLRDRFAFGPGDVSILTIPLNFDPHVVQYSSALFNGGRLVIAGQTQHLDASSLMSLVAEQGVTYLNSVPVLGREYFNTPQARLCKKLRVVMFSGEPLPKELVELVHRVSGLNTTNAYGPTEATVNITHALCSPTDSLVTIGPVDDNSHAYIVDARLRPVPIGVPGELLLSGPRLAIGYAGRPDLTADKFIPNPCLHMVRDDIPPSMLQYFQRAYRTGDLVRWRPDGQIEYMGRIDRQIKINGVRIELGEVEGALGTAPGVEQAVASAVTDDRGVKRLVAYATPASADANEVIQHCRSLLVAAMVPSVVVVLEAFPLLPNGKVDVKALPAPDWGVVAAEEYVAPVNEVEELIQRIWMQVLDLEDPISTSADYFAIGGTSLTAAGISAAVRTALGLKQLPATLLLNNTTIKRYVQAILEFAAREDTSLLRSTTRRGLGHTTKRLLMLSKSVLEGQTTTTLSAESVGLARQLPYPVRLTALPRAAYVALQLLASSVAAAVVPAAQFAFFLAGALCWRSNGFLAFAALAPLLYTAMLFWLAGLLILAKTALFPQRMRPGLYPLYGGVYLRWITYRALHRSVLGVLERYIRRTRLLAVLFRCLGAHIDEDVLLDSANLFEPDLIAIGEGTTVADGATISAAFVVPAGFLDEEPCLVFSTTRVGMYCTIGSMSSVQPGGRLPDGHSLLPYATISQPKGVIAKNVEERYSHFYPEQHLTTRQAELCAAASGIVAYLGALPGVVAAALALYLLSGVTVAGALGAVRDGLNGTGPQWPLVALPLAFMLVIYLVFTQVAKVVTSALVVAYKQRVMGPLAAGRGLLESEDTLMRYAVFRRLLDLPFFDAGINAANLGAKVGPTSRIHEGLVEFDAITIGPLTTAGGATRFRCVDAEGVIHPITIEAGAQCGHTTFFPGATVKEGARIGNETSIYCNQVVLPNHQVQGGSQFRMRPAEAQRMREAAAALATPPPEGLAAWPVAIKAAKMLGLTALKHLFDWVPLAAIVALTSRATGLSPKAVLTVYLPLLAFTRGVLAVAWLRIASWLVDSRNLIRSGGFAREDDPAFKLWALSVMSFNAVWDAFRGSGPLYQTALRLIGCAVEPGAVVLAAAPVEVHLQHVGAGAALDWEARVVPHFIRGGAFFFQGVRVEEHAWAQGPCRVLNPVRVGARARIMPGTTSLPNEDIAPGSVWAGCPAAPVSEAAQEADHVAKEVRRTKQAQMRSSASYLQ